MCPASAAESPATAQVATWAALTVRVAVSASGRVGACCVRASSAAGDGARRASVVVASVAVVCSGICLEVFLRAYGAGAARAAPILRSVAPNAADLLFESPKKNDDVESPLLDLSAPPAASYGSGFEGAAFTPKSVKWSAVGVDAPRTA